MVPIDSVIVDSRARFDKGDIEEMAISLLKHGQLQPILIDENNKLVAGERRLLGAQLNQWTEIWASTRDDLDEVQKLEIEIEENIQRKAFTAAEEIQAIAKLDQLRRSQDPNWSQDLTAVVANVHRSQVSTATKYSKMIDLFPELKEAKSIRQLKSWADSKAASVNRVIEVRDNAIDYSAIESKVILGDSTKVIKMVPDESFNAVITDPPFGIGFDERVADSGNSVNSYEDSEEAYLRLLGMAPDLYRVIKPNGWLIWFLGISWYERAKTAFRESGFIVDEIPIIWDRSEGKSYTARPDRYFARAYDIALHCIKGDPQVIKRGRPNIIKAKPVENPTTLVERPIELYAELISRLTIPGETVADFFAGSGSCLAAAVSLGRDYFGVEQDVERRAYAITKIKGYTPTELK